MLGCGRQMPWLASRSATLRLFRMHKIRNAIYTITTIGIYRARALTVGLYYLTHSQHTSLIYLYADAISRINASKAKYYLRHGRRA